MTAVTFRSPVTCGTVLFSDSGVSRVTQTVYSEYDLTYLEWRCQDRLYPTPQTKRCSGTLRRTYAVDLTQKHKSNLTQSQLRGLCVRPHRWSLSDFPGRPVSHTGYLNRQTEPGGEKKKLTFFLSHTQHLVSSISAAGSELKGTGSH